LLLLNIISIFEGIFLGKKLKKP